MRAALAEARKGLGRTAPNPAVGCVVVDGGAIVGKGWHHRAGEPHAEVVALRQAGSKARGATMFVSLEPCSVEGRTGPCTQAIIEAGVARVVVGCQDPNPRIDGAGIRQLREAGIDVSVGVLEHECQRLNEAFERFIIDGRPFVSLKAAMTLDGKIATATGSSQWITGEEAREEGHRLRDRVDAILVGVETIRHDNPALTVRRRGRKARATLRVILDSHLRTPATARVLAPVNGSPRTLIVCAPDPNPSAALRLIDAGAEILEVPRTAEGLDLHRVLRALASRNVVHLLVEGGAAVATSFLREALVDKVHFFLAPKLVGSDGRTIVGELGVQDIGAALQFTDVTTRRIGNDILLEGYPDYRTGSARHERASDSGDGSAGLEDDELPPHEVTFPAVAVAAPNLFFTPP